MRIKEIAAGGLVSLVLTGCSTYKTEYIGIEGYSCERWMCLGDCPSPTVYTIKQGSQSASLTIYNKTGSIHISYNSKLWLTQDDVLKTLNACVESFKTFDNRKMKK